MKTREWLFTIAIIILIQFIVQMGALAYSKDNNVLNYVSFAGTIVSIILAIIAIVYSFVQTLSQQSSSSNISNQVDKLISAADQINDSKNKINTSIEYLKNASERLDAAIEHQSNINNEIKTLSKQFSELDNFKKPQSNQSRQPNTPHSKDTAIGNFSDWNHGTQFCMGILYLGSQNNFSIEETMNSITVPIMKKIYSDIENKDETILFYMGAVTSAFYILNLCNFVYTENNKIRLHQKLEDECRNAIDQLEHSTEETLFKSFLITYKESERSL